MDVETAVLVLREVNLVLGLVAFFWLLFKSAKHWNEYSTAIRAYSMALLFFCFAAAYLSGEMIAQEVVPGLRSVFILVANVSLLVALWLVRGRYTFGVSDQHQHAFFSRSQRSGKP